MSRMFDELNRAEQERRRAAEGIEEARREEGDRPESPPAPELRAGIAAPGQGLGALPAEFLREMGILRNSLEELFAGAPRRSILFTSSVAEEGTTTIATNFARFVAMQGEGRILLCEMNARRPAFKNVFSLNGDAGVTDYFVSQAELGGIVQKIAGECIDVLHAGHQDPAVLHIHLKQAMPKLLRDAAQLYDTVIIDAPPLIGFPETPPMTPFVDGVVLVVHAGKTRREVVARAVESVHGFAGKVLGVVLNRKKYYIPDVLYKRI